VKALNTDFSTNASHALRSAFDGKNALVTGGLGFLGSTLARSLADLGANVVLVDSLVPQYGGNLRNIADFQDKVRINISDVRDKYSIAHLIQNQDFLFNLAGQSSHLDSMVNPFTDLEINCGAQLSILEACRNYNTQIKVVFASTRQVYGKPNYLPVDENHLVNPVDVNGINKLAGEQYHVLYNNIYNVRASVLRLTNSYGPHMRVKDARQTFLGLWIRQIIEGAPFEVWDGQQLRDFTYSEDVVTALLLAAASEDANGQVFNLGGECSLSLTGLAELLIEANGGGAYTVRSFPQDQKKIDIGHYYADWNRIHRVLGWEPCVPLREGLERTLAFYRIHLGHYL
jgi:UDP-glucose 4-epimerase